MKNIPQTQQEIDDLVGDLVDDLAEIPLPRILQNTNADTDENPYLFDQLKDQAESLAYDELVDSPRWKEIELELDRLMQLSQVLEQEKDSMFRFRTEEILQKIIKMKWAL